MPVFQEIEALPLTDRVAAALKDAFFSGKLKPGDAIIERQLAAEMKVGTPVVREALISLHGQGFVRRITNTGTFVTKFDAEEVRQLYTLRIELETLALEWARPRVSADDIATLKGLVDKLVEAGQAGARREFSSGISLSTGSAGNSPEITISPILSNGLMAPLFAFVVLASGVPMTAAMAREHYALVNALENLQPPEFDAVVRKAFTGFALRWISTMSPQK
jgi:DNA-binding GntR family transcriptional regulator